MTISLEAAGVGALIFLVAWLGWILLVRRCRRKKANPDTSGFQLREATPGLASDTTPRQPGYAAPRLGSLSMGALDGRENGHVNVNVNVNEPPQPVDRWTAGADGPLEMMPQVALVSSPLTEGYSANIYRTASRADGRACGTTRLDAFTVQLMANRNHRLSQPTMRRGMAPVEHG